MIRPFIILLLLTFLPDAVAATYLLKPKSLYCVEDRLHYLGAIVDAKSEDQLKSAVTSAIYTGACVAPLPSYFVVAEVKRKKSAGGNFISCFEVVDSDREQRYCSLSKNLSTIASEKQTRTGDYKIIWDNGSGTKAECLEGGIVMIEKSQQWMRYPLLFTLVNERVETKISKNLEAEIRLGCKGFDYPN